MDLEKKICSINVAFLGVKCGTIVAFVILPKTFLQNLILKL